MLLPGAPKYTDCGPTPTIHPPPLLYLSDMEQSPTRIFGGSLATANHKGYLHRPSCAAATLAASGTGSLLGSDNEETEPYIIVRFIPGENHPNLNKARPGTTPCCAGSAHTIIARQHWAQWQQFLQPISKASKTTGTHPTLR